MTATCRWRLLLLRIVVTERRLTQGCEQHDGRHAGRAGLAMLTAPHTAHLSADSLAQQQQQQQPRQRLFRQQLMLVQLINYKRQLARRPTGCCRCVLEPVGGGVTGAGTDPAYSPSHLSTSSGH